MDNLRNVIELLFLDRDVKEVLDTLEDDKEESEVVSNKVFKNLFLSKYRRYSGNQLNSLFDITNDEWTNLIIDSDNVRTIFNLLYSLTSQVLDVDGINPICKYTSYLRWHKATEPIGEDILTTNFLAIHYLIHKLTGDGLDFAWSPYLLTNKQFNFKESKLAELHCHLAGSSLIFTLNWLSIMNNPKGCKEGLFKKITNMTDAHKKIMLAAFIRAYLYKEVKSIKNEAFEEVLNPWLSKNNKLDIEDNEIAALQDYIELMRNEYGDILDYAIPKHLSDNIKNNCDSRKCLVGERKLLYVCFSKLYRKETNQKFNALFYVYLIIKSQFRLAMIQINSIIGFENFYHYDKNKFQFLCLKRKDLTYQAALIEIGVKIHVQQTNVNYIEYRIAPNNFEADINQAEKHCSVSHCYIVHFIKGEEDGKCFEVGGENDIRYRNYEVRNNIEKQAEDLVKYKSNCENENKECLIKGIDAANSEFYCRPEVFGHVFRKLREKGFKITYHVGEDFYDIVDGLRAIDEAMIFLNLQKGDRIGHGTVLGLDANKYYDGIFRAVVMPKQVLLDNVAWLLYKVEKYVISCDTGCYEILKLLYIELIEKIYGKEFKNTSIQTYHNAWLLRGDDPKMYNSKGVDRDAKEDDFQLNDALDVIKARKDDGAVNLFYQYHYKSEVKHRGHKSIECNIDKKYIHSFVRVVSKIQEKMQQEVAKKGIHIECNPTSNLRIGNIEKYSEHPIVKFHGKGLTLCKSLCCKPNISVSINTDDAGIFATSLEKEYTLMAVALSKEVDEKGHKKYSERRIMKWLDNIRQEAIKHQFLKSIK